MQCCSELRYFLYLFLLGLCWLIQPVLCICDSVTTSDSILWLQKNRRCMWIGTTSFPNWAASMDYCVSQGGYLAHIYSATDRASILAWKAASTKGNSICHLGLYKDTAHGKEDGTQTHWRLSNTAMLPMDMSYQYRTFVDDWSVFLDILGILVLFSDQPFTVQANEKLTFDTTAAYPICEQSTPKMKAVYTATSGKRTQAPIVLSQTGQRTRRDCARLCGRLTYCLGYNAITVSATSITCNFITVKAADSGLALVTDATTVYYELQ